MLTLVTAHGSLHITATAVTPHVSIGRMAYPPTACGGAVQGRAGQPLRVGLFDRVRIEHLDELPRVFAEQLLRALWGMPQSKADVRPSGRYALSLLFVHTGGLATTGAPIISCAIATVV